MSHTFLAGDGGGDMVQWHRFSVASKGVKREGLRKGRRGGREGKKEGRGRGGEGLREEGERKDGGGERTEKDYGVNSL